MVLVLAVMAEVQGVRAVDCSCGSVQAEAVAEGVVICRVKEGQFMRDQIKRNGAGMVGKKEISSKRQIQCRWARLHLPGIKLQRGVGRRRRMRIKLEISGKIMDISPSSSKKNLQQRYKILTHPSLDKVVITVGLKITRLRNARRMLVRSVE